MERPVGPPVEYTAATPEPAVPAKPVSNSAWSKYVTALLQALREANADKASIRTWAESLTSKE